ncbi:DUF3577 domain-containing protein [uncultured Pseudoteredinibacter sp.]|uniref:DUF3577 domain-containing protein n=1 Tax=uncultured Pseudoteredinibacter sp. TaxID=1641701 RepID=UPI00260649CD|nr:DUF3577 domain-containing protein [uncultured Pseudoteredinibacter sp.]
MSNNDNNTPSGTQQPAQSSTEQNRYFNQYSNGIGYINGIREFGEEGKATRYAAQISVLQGSVDDVHYEYHDLVISSETALGVLMENRPAIEDENQKVLLRFHMTNPRAKGFVYKQGDRAGEIGTSIGGFLTRVMSLKVDGELIYEDTRLFGEESDVSQAANA